MSIEPLGESFTLAVLPSEADAMKQHFAAFGFVATVLPQPEARILLSFTRPQQTYKLPATGAKGFDRSHYQGPLSAGALQQAIDAGYTWGAFKLGENATLDIQAVNSIKLAQAAHFAYMLFVEWRYDVATLPQAIWINTILNAIGELPPLGLAIAVEENYKLVNGVSVQVPPANFAASIPGDCQLMFERVKCDTPSLWLSCYSRRSFISAWLPNAAWLGGFDLWNAYYPFTRPTFGVTTPRVHSFWLNPDGTPSKRVIAWQYYAPGTGLSYSQIVPGMGDIDQSFWLNGPSG